MPRAELVRATLLTGATDIENPGPDYASGYGNLNVKKALQIAKEGLVWQDSVQEGAKALFTIPVTAQQDQNLKITLAWNDPPAEIGVSSPLVHDLDLRVTDPNGQIWYPFVLSSFPDPDSLAAPATQRPIHSTTRSKYVFPM
ncbi:MAG: hypothetical protein IPL27_22280 [Lewinellaceae bacterium]|nr:hypothetical protein [Lewinellaceae bacterium]